MTNAHALINVANQLNHILFALNIDTPELDIIDDQEEKEYSTRENGFKAPVRRNTSNAVLVKSNKKRSQVIKIKDASASTLSEDGECLLSTSAPTFSSSLNDKSPSLNESESDASGTSSFVVRDASNMVLFPISSCDSDEDNVSTVKSRDDHEEDQHEQILELKHQNSQLTVENSLLKIQLKKYIAAIELMKNSSKNEKVDDHLKDEEVPEMVVEPVVQASVESNNDEQSKIDRQATQADIELYEHKLMQVSEMHGELVEFNDHLYRVIQQKDTIISRLRDELVELRGPLPDSDDLMSLSSETDTQSHSISTLPQLLIHIWIPTAFLSGGFKGKSHHIYQIYVRLKDEEWNVYRRYSQFYTLHKFLKEKYPPIGVFDFPPKKAIGNKDSRVVQERRKKLEFYLRNVINLIQSQNSELQCKDKLIQLIPFLR